MTWYLMDLPEHYLMDPIIVLSLQDADPAIHVLSESRCADEVQRAPREKNGLVGSIVLYMLLRVDTMFNKMISDFLRLSSFPTSGWKETLEASECSYIKAILPEQKPAEKESKRQRETTSWTKDIKKHYEMYKRHCSEKSVSSKVSIFSSILQTMYTVVACGLHYLT